VIHSGDTERSSSRLICILAMHLKVPESRLASERRSLDRNLQQTFAVAKNSVLVESLLRITRLTRYKTQIFAAELKFSICFISGSAKKILGKFRKTQPVSLCSVPPRLRISGASDGLKSNTPTKNCVLVSASWKFLRSWRAWKAGQSSHNLLQTQVSAFWFRSFQGCNFVPCCDRILP